MLTKITGETPFQVLTSSFSISPSEQGYVLNISANGKDFSPLFTVGAGVTRLVTGMASGSYYKLVGNEGDVVVNWVRSCITPGGDDNSSSLTPVSDFPLNADAGTVIAYSGSSSAAGIYQFDGTEWNEAGGTVSLDGYWTSAQTVDYVQDALSGISLDGYWTSAQTQSAITAVEDHLYDVEEVTASALTELHTGLLEVSARTVDLSGYYTSAQTEQAITNKNYVTSAQVETQITDKNYITSAYVSDALTAYTPTSGFSTINGSAITSGGNIEIQAGGDMDVLKAVDEFPADPELGDMVSKLSYPVITSWDLSYEAKTHLDQDYLDTEGTYTIATFESDSGATDVVLMYDDGEDAWALSVDVGGDAVGGFIISEDSAETSAHIVNQYYASIGWVEDDFSGLGGMMLSIRKTNGTFNQVDGDVTDIPDFEVFDIVDTGADPEADGPAYYDGEKWVNVKEEVEKVAEDKLVGAFPRMPHFNLDNGNTDIEQIKSAIFDVNGNGDPISNIMLFDTAFDWLNNNIDWEADADVPNQFTTDPVEKVAYIENIPAGNYVLGLYKDGPGENYDPEFDILYWSNSANDGLGDWDWQTITIESTCDPWDMNVDMEMNRYWRDKFECNVAITNYFGYFNWSFPKDVKRFEIRIVDDGQGNESLEINITYKEDVTTADDFGYGIVNKIVKLDQNQYDQLVLDDEIDPDTFYIIVPPNY